MKDKQLIIPYQYLRFGLIVKFIIEDGDWVIRRVISNRKSVELRLPIKTNNIQQARKRTLKWIDSGYKEF